jgi:hypothetical protein
MSPGAQRLFLYLLTCPHSNLIGLYILKNGYIMEDLDLSPQSLKTQMQEIVDHGMIARCPVNFITYIPNYLKFNPLTNPNQVTSAIGIVESMPKSVIIRDFILSLEGLNKGLNESLREGLVSVLESVLELESEDLPEKLKPRPQKAKEYITPLLGEHKNVRLTQEQYNGLIEYVGGKDAALDLIEQLSIYMASKGKTYSNHYATMQGWHRNNKKENGNGTTAQDEQKREDLKRELKIAEESLERAEEAHKFTPDKGSMKRRDHWQREVDRLRRELN